MGNNSTFAILSNNKVYGWGSSKSGKLGFELSGGKNYDLPREIISLSSYPIFQIAAGSFHTLLLTKDGKLLVMGNSKDGKLGLDFENPNTIQDVELPEIVEMTDQVNNGSKWFIQDMTILDEKKYPLFDEYESYKLYGKLAPVCTKDIPYEIVQIAAGENFQMFLTNNGELYACGQNKYGQIGKEEQESDDEEEEKNEKSSDEEEQKEDEENKDGEGSLFMAPELRKKFDQLKKNQEQWEPIQVKTKILGTITKVKFVAAGASHALCLLETSKEVLGWGNNKYGQLGTGSNQGDMVFYPTPVKGLMTEEEVLQIACGEKHTLFLMSNAQIMSCGSNEFGQLGLYFDAIDQEGTKTAGRENQFSPSTILAQHCDNVVYIACGRFHSVAIRRQTNADEFRDEEEEDEGQQGKGGKQNQDKSKTFNFENEFEKRIVVEVKHDLYTWGRGYQGQLGHKDLKVAQWLPKRVFFRKDKSFKEESQPNSFAMVTCGEKHTLVLTNSGYVWWSGEKYAVGKEDPNLSRKNKFEVKDDILSYQQYFVHFFDVIPSKQGQKILFKNISSNFNAKLSFAIDQENKPYIFGENIPFQEIQIKKGISLATAGKNFQTILSRDRLPFTWGDLKHGRLGLGEIEQISKKKKVQQPTKITYFQKELRDIYDQKDGKFLKEGLLPKQREDYNKMYFRENLNIELELKDDNEIRNFEPKFEMQQILKKDDQERIESDLIQQDTDLIISFKSCIAQIFEIQKKKERQMMMRMMQSQDVINAVVETFPIKNIDRLNDVISPIPKLILLNKQVYEILFSLLQTHPCYLINWICSALKQEIDLFDYHPQAHLDEFPEWDELCTHSNQYYSISEQNIIHDEICLLLMNVYGGWKNIRNDRRIISNLITIGIKVFEFELEDASKSEPKVQYKLAEILGQQVETGFARICRLVFQSQTCNVAFVDELTASIVNLLNSNLSKFISQRQKLLDESTKKEIQKINQQCFDFESCLQNDDLSQWRADKLVIFLKLILDNILLPNISKKNREARKNDCQSFFSSETLLMVLKAAQIFKEKCNNIFRRTFPKNMTEKDKIDYENYVNQQKVTEESIKQIMLGCLFEDLCLRLQTLRPETVINIVGMKAYQENPTLQIVQVRSNFFFVGEALRALLTGKPITFKQEFLKNFRNFIEQKNLQVDTSSAPQDGLNWRERIFMHLEEYKPPDELANFDQYLIQVSIEESMQLNNPICTIQLRNIVYIHNQLILYGDKYIYKRGFKEISNNQQLGIIPIKNNKKKDEDEEDQESEDEVKIDEDEHTEMDPCKLVMMELGNQYIILRIQKQEFITQQTLNVQINMQIKTRIFEQYKEFVRCNDCNALVYEGLLPRQRFLEGLNMKKWVCGNPSCKFENTIEISLSCKKCGSARQKSTLPLDLIFPLYVPPNPAIEINRQTNIFERLLKVIPMIDIQESLTQELNKLKIKEKEKPVKDFEKIKIIEDCLDMIENYVLKNRASFGYTGKESQIEDVQISIKVQDSLYDTLQEQIKINIQRRKEHQAVLNRNIALIVQLKDRLLTAGNQHDILITSLNRCEQNAKIIVGNEEFLQSDFSNQQIQSGKLKQQKKSSSSKGDKNKQANEQDDIGKYFADMKEKSQRSVPNAKLQKKLEENKARRQLMQSQFGQFSSFDANQLIQDGVIFDDIKIDQVEIKSIINQCKFLFYELREDPENDIQGGYRVELSFEEKGTGLLGACLPGSGPGSQSILSSFIISNEVLSEMKRIMATKCTVRFQGARFNIFKLVKLIGTMKTKNQAVQNNNS